LGRKQALAIEDSVGDILLDQKDFDTVLLSLDDYDVLPATKMLSKTSRDILSEVGNSNILKRQIAKEIDQYDYVLLDCPPSLDILTVNALTLASEVFIVLQCEYFALEAMGKIVEHVETIKKAFENPLTITGVIPTFHNNRKRLNQDVLSAAEDFFPTQVFNTRIRENIALSEAQGQGKHIFSYQKNSQGASDYMDLVSEIIKQERTL